MKKLLWSLMLIGSTLTAIGCGVSETQTLNGDETSSEDALTGPLNFVYPVDGQTLTYGPHQAYMFKVNPVDGASGYLWGFFQNGDMIFENNRDLHHLDGTEFALQPGTAGHDAVKVGDLKVMVRALVNNQWTGARSITVHIRIATPVAVFPAQNHVYNYGPYQWSVWVNPVADATGYLYGFFQNGQMVYENLRDLHHLDSNFFALSATSPGHAALRPGDVQILVRAQVNNVWSDALVLNVKIAVPSPTFVYPVQNQTLGFGTNQYYMFKVNPVAGATGYLWAFNQNGVEVFENYRDLRHLDGTDFNIAPGTLGHERLAMVPTRVTVRALVGGYWSDERNITINFVPAP